jgi:hypothetical protein
MKKRCAWSGTDPLAIDYHDKEWGVPVHDDRKLFEMLILEGAQAGLSWMTILRKRENYRKAFDNFDAKSIARYDGKKIKRLLVLCNINNLNMYYNFRIMDSFRTLEESYDQRPTQTTSPPLRGGSSSTKCSGAFAFSSAWACDACPGGAYGC